MNDNDDEDGGTLVERLDQITTRLSPDEGSLTSEEYGTLLDISDYLHSID